MSEEANKVAIRQIIKQAVTVLEKGGLIAYPTESCYGLGCDPDNLTAVQRLLDLKQRSMHKGLILIADQAARFDVYLAWPDEKKRQEILDSWPGPVTWLIPTKLDIARHLTGEHSSLAVRVPKHVLARDICQVWGKPLVSTSANPQGQPSALTAKQVEAYFGAELDLIIDGQIGASSQPSKIIDAQSGNIIRQ